MQTNRIASTTHSKMSSSNASAAAGAVDYENYSVTSLDYDSARVTYGIEVIVGSLCCSAKQPLKNLHLLDAGCGTGSFTAALSGLVGKVTGVELNEGMRRRALEKTARLENVEIKEGNVTDLHGIFPDSQFDGVLINQVIHHLNEVGSTGLPNIKKFIAEAHRVLKPGGALIINTASPEQCCKSMWHVATIPPAAEGISKRMAPISTLQEFMVEAGFKAGPFFMLPETQHSKEYWSDKEVVLKEDNRNTDSAFSLATPEETKMHLDIWKRKIEDGTADQFIAEWEENRKRLGLSVTVIGYKQ